MYLLVAGARTHCKQSSRTTSIYSDIRLKEMEQFKLVMGHEQYRSNPLGILKEHLSNTVKLQQRSKQ